MTWNNIVILLNADGSKTTLSTHIWLTDPHYLSGEWIIKILKEKEKWVLKPDWNLFYKRKIEKYRVPNDWTKFRHE